MATLNFDASSVDPQRPMDVIPAGKYVAVICESQTKPTQSGTGQYLELVYQIIDGEHRNRKLWSRHNIMNPNQQTVAIARAELSAICHAAKKLVISDSVELHNLPMVITVKVVNRKDTGEPANEVKGWEATSQPSHAQAQPQQSGKNTPWKR